MARHHLFQGRVAAFGHVIIDLFRIDDADVVQQHQFRGALFVAAEIIGAVGQLFIVRSLAGPVVGQDLLDLVRGEVAVHHFVDLHGRGHFADPQAGGVLQGEETVLGGVVQRHPQLGRVNCSRLSDVQDMAGRRLAHADDVLAFGLPGVHGIKAHHPEDVAALDIEAGGDALLDRRRQIAHRLLDLLQDRHQSAGN